MVTAKASKDRQEIDQLQQRIDQRASNLKGLDESIRTRQERLGEIEAKQRSLLLEARVKKNSEAQGLIDSLFGEADALRREIFLDVAAREAESQEHEKDEAELKREQWRARCEEVKGLIRQHLKDDLEGRVAELVSDLYEASAALTDAEKKIADALRALDPSMYPLAMELGFYFPQRRQWTNAYRLRNTLGLPVRELPAGAAATKRQKEKWFMELMDRIDAAPEGKAKA